MSRSDILRIRSTLPRKFAGTFCRMFGHRWQVGPWRERLPVIAGVTHTRETACLRCPVTVTEPHYGLTGTAPDEGP